MVLRLLEIGNHKPKATTKKIEVEADDGDHDEFEFEEEDDDDDEDLELVKLKAKGSNWRHKRYSPVDNIRCR